MPEVERANVAYIDAAEEGSKVPEIMHGRAQHLKYCRIFERHAKRISIRTSAGWDMVDAVGDRRHKEQGGNIGADDASRRAHATDARQDRGL